MWALSCGERGDGRFGLLVPSAAQSLVLLGLNVVQDFRYQFGVYLIGLVVSPSHSAKLFSAAHLVHVGFDPYVFSFNGQ